MTNLERWRHFMKYYESPDIYIDWGFYFTVAAYLQRRVWYGPEIDPLFANPYVILVGKPATGKGRVIKNVASVVQHHKISAGDPSQQALVIPCSADSVTLERLTQNLARCARTFTIKIDGMPTKQRAHSSMACILEELSSMFRQNTEDLARFFNQAWDCGDYKRETKHSGEDVIKNVCLSMLAGTQPSFVQECVDKKVLSEGLAARILFVFADAPRMKMFDFEFEQSQIEARVEMLKHLEKLSKIVGQARFSKEAYEKVVAWYEKSDVRRANQSPILDDYYGRKKVHVIKTAMAVHFADSLDFEITLGDLEVAMKILQQTEERMHLAIKPSGRSFNNPLADVQDQITKYIIEQKKASAAQILLQFRLRNSDFQEILQTLKELGLIKTEVINGQTYITSTKRNNDGGSTEGSSECPIS